METKEKQLPEVRARVKLAEEIRTHKARLEIQVDGRQRLEQEKEQAEAAIDHESVWDFKAQDVRSGREVEYTRRFVRYSKLVGRLVSALHQECNTIAIIRSLEEPGELERRIQDERWADERRERKPVATFDREVPKLAQESDDVQEIIFALRREGWGFEPIARLLESRGFETRRGGRWSSTTVRNMWLRGRKQ